MEDYRELFISELDAYIKDLNAQLLLLESNQKASAAIVEVFRIFHTVKGMAQTMGFSSLSNISHRIEDCLGEAKKKGTISLQLVDFLFTVVDFLTASSNALKNKKMLPAGDEIIQGIENINQGRALQYSSDIMGTTGFSEIRVKLEKLDTLFNLTNELAITKSRMTKISTEIGDPRLKNQCETASMLIGALQDEVMRLRMLPLSVVFDFFPRWFRDESKRQGKKVALEIVGGDLEVDRSIIDVLKEPLMHLLRNALDHGIRPDLLAEERDWKIKLEAVREKEWISISVSDNGVGIDIERIREKAINDGLIAKQEVKRYSEDDFYRLLIRPDFSTRDEVSLMSGRGIGLNIVNSAVVKLGGRFSISSLKNEGTSFKLELPLSLAVVRAMIFSLNGQRFALPLNFVQETFYLQEDPRTVYHRELYPLRDRILPLVRLSKALDCSNEQKGRKSVIVVDYEGKSRGFIADKIIDEEEIVVKKLDKLLTAPFYSGCSVYADGLPILILDPRGFE
jgi:two-component system chemotaxis sensor kinase CheA